MNQNAFFEALGWSLIDSLWQMGAIWLVYIVTTRNGTRYSAGKRHSLAFGGIFAGTLLFFTSIIINALSVASHGKIFSFAHFIERQAGTLLSEHGGISSMVKFLSYLYLPALLFFVCRTVIQLIAQRNQYRKNLLPPGRDIAELANDIAVRVGIDRRVMIWLSSKIESPLTLGFWKPVILLPIALCSHLSYKQIEAVLAHELFHIKRNDYLLNIFLTVSETVLFFNPFARLLAANVKKERENSCDDMVLAAGFDALEYSEALYVLGRFRQHGRFTLAATGAGKEYLLQRIRRILKRQNPRPSLLKPFIAFFLCLVVTGFLSRQKQAPVLAETIPAVETKPVIYHYYEKQIIIKSTEPAKAEKKGSIARKKFNPPAANENSVPPFKHPPAPPDAPGPPPEIDVKDVIITTYVAAPAVIEFTIIDPVEPEVPQVICETPQPYVPKSAFYYTEIDSTGGRKVITL